MLLIAQLLSYTNPFSNPLLLLTQVQVDKNARGGGGIIPEISPRCCCCCSCSWRSRRPTPPRRPTAASRRVGGGAMGCRRWWPWPPPSTGDRIEPPPPPPGSPLFPPPPSLSRACCTRDLGFVGWVLARFGVLLGSWFSGVGEICDLAVDQVKSLRWKNACVSRSIFLRDPWCVVGDSSPTSSSRSWVGLGSLCIWGCLIPDFLASDPTRGFPPCS